MRIVREGGVLRILETDPSQVLVYRIEDDLYVVLTREKLKRILGEKVDLRRRKGRDFWVFEDEVSAQEFSRRKREEIERGEILGIRGFDGKYYAMTRESYAWLRERLKRMLDGEKSVDDLARELRLPEDKIRACLEIMRERGEAVEVKKGVFRGV